MSCGIALLCALSALSDEAAAQQRPPTENELHSVYCVEVLRAQITLQRHLISASSEAAGVSQPELRAQWLATSTELLRRLARLQGALYRHQAYVLPRVPTIDSLILAAAIRQAGADARSWSDTAAVTRESACENPTWLPG